jgi:hypothetical protein
MISQMQRAKATTRKKIVGQTLMPSSTVMGSPPAVSQVASGGHSLSIAAATAATTMQSPMTAMASAKLMTTRLFAPLMMASK